MKQLLDPKMLNYRAADYFTGSKSIAGAEEYFYGGRTTPSYSISGWNSSSTER